MFDVNICQSTRHPNHPIHSASNSRAHRHLLQLVFESTLPTLDLPHVQQWHHGLILIQQRSASTPKWTFSMKRRNRLWEAVRRGLVTKLHLDPFPLFYAVCCIVWNMLEYVEINWNVFHVGMAWHGYFWYSCAKPWRRNQTCQACGAGAGAPGAKGVRDSVHSVQPGLNSYR